MGITNKAVKNFFELNRISYQIYYDTNDEKNINDEILANIDYIIKSPGIKFNHPLLKLADEKKIEVISDLELLSRIFPNNEYIIVTGSNGKTTTTHLINEMLKGYPLFKDGMIGNIGIPIFDKVNLSRNRRGYIIEASSFMLHNTYSLKPSIYLLTSLTSHHLDYHEKTENYFYDKIKLINNMNENDYLIYNMDDINVSNLVNDYSKVIKYSVSLYNKEATCYIENNIIYYQKHPIIIIDELNKKDEGTLIDIMLSIVTSKIYHISKRKIIDVLKKFNGLEYRTQIVYESDSLIIMNDSKATSPHASLQAIKFVKDKYPTHHHIYLFGGKMVDNDYQSIINILSKKDEIYIYGSSKVELSKIFKDFNPIVKDTIDEIINQLSLKLKTIIVFSPSCVSYDQFSSYIERGKKFDFLISRKCIKS